MLKREDLEGIEWEYVEQHAMDAAGVYCCHSGRLLLDSTDEEAIGMLAAAAPALALACLAAREAILFAESHGASDNGEGYRREIEILEEALAAAGVEIE